jgi:nucleotide-binding universal stress UspA family protein
LGADLQTEPIIRLGTAHTEIVRIARELGIDLIILSTKGRTGLAHVFLGSTAEKVVRHASCPVLVVREHGRDFVEAAEASPRVA